MIGPSAILLTTCHLENDGVADLVGLVRSVEVAVRGGELANVRHVVLLQGSTAEQAGEIKRQLPDWAEILSVEGRLSSPAARNVMIHRLMDDASFAPDAFVAFPDDDAWYPSGALACVAAHFQSPDLQLLLCRYGPSPSAAGCSTAFAATLQQALSRGACAAIFVRAALLAELGGFHPLLGLGTRLSGGEDTEFVHRAFQRAGKNAAWVPGFLVGHAAAEPAKKAKYYEGGLTAIMAHSRTSAAARVALVRKLAVGIWLVLKRQMSFPAYLRSVRVARANAPLIRSGIII